MRNRVNAKDVATACEIFYHKARRDREGEIEREREKAGEGGQHREDLPLRPLGLAATVRFKTHILGRRKVIGFFNCGKRDAKRTYQWVSAKIMVILNLGLNLKNGHYFCIDLIFQAQHSSCARACGSEEIFCSRAQ